jgi:alanyl-tRNA synthetase
MTERLYYSDPYRTAFSATVVASDESDGRFEVVLDRTAFYPTSGGQPFDVGTLADARVLDVVEREDGEIAHVIDRALSVGATVEGTIDWTRRFDHMQQHTGQHVLSAAFDRLFQVRTESFHLGKDSSSIDLAREVTVPQIRAVEDEANRVVWEDRPVHIRVASAEEARQLPLRKESLRGGSIRLIDVENFDLSACGGTHVGRTGAIGVIAIAAWEKFRGGSRVQFLCGGRALARFREWRDALAATTRHLSVQPADLAAAVERLQGDAKEVQKTIRGLQERIATHEARALVERAERAGDRLFLVDALEGWDAPGLKALAAAATAATPTLAIALFSRSSPPVTVVAAGPSARLDASAVLKALIATFGGRGGGRPELAQGGGFNAKVDDLLAAARSHLQAPPT